MGPHFERAGDSLLSAQTLRAERNLDDWRSKIDWHVSRNAKAEPLYKRAPAIIEQSFGIAHPSTGTIADGKGVEVSRTTDRRMRRTAANGRHGGERSGRCHAAIFGEKRSQMSLSRSDAIRPPGLARRTPGRRNVCLEVIVEVRFPIHRPHADVRAERSGAFMEFARERLRRSL